MNFYSSRFIFLRNLIFTKIPFFFFRNWRYFLRLICMRQPDAICIFFGSIRSFPTKYLAYASPHALSRADAVNQPLRFIIFVSFSDINSFLILHCAPRSQYNFFKWKDKHTSTFLVYFGSYLCKPQWHIQAPSTYVRYNFFKCNSMRSAK